MASAFVGKTMGMSTSTSSQGGVECGFDDMVMDGGLQAQNNPGFETAGKVHVTGLSTDTLRLPGNVLPGVRRRGGSSFLRGTSTRVIFVNFSEKAGHFRIFGKDRAILIFLPKNRAILVFYPFFLCGELTLFRGNPK